MQLHKAEGAAALFGRNGGGFTHRFPTITAAVLALPLRSCIIDGELIAAGADGEPNFLALLHGRRAPVCVYAFDLMELQGKDLRDLPLEVRREVLRNLLLMDKGKSWLIRFSETFSDAGVLLAECARRGLEGIVAKRKGSPYRLGTRSGGWKEANQYGVKLFNTR